MTMYALIENKLEGKVTASLIGWPDITADGNSEEEAVRSLRRSLAAHLQDARIVPFELREAQAWLQTAGAFKDDPFADELDAVLAEYRRERDSEDLTSTTQDHAA